MNFFQAILLGIVQGVTEFLPISSSGHLAIFQNIFGLQEPQILFDIFLHLGTLLAVFVVFWKDIIDLFTTKIASLLYLVIATLVTVIWALLFHKHIEAVFLNVRFIGLMLIITGVWLILGSFVRFGGETISWFKAAIIGLAQGIAALPGISRSGATISTGMFLGLSSKAAARFSFLLSIPAIIGAFLFKLKSSPQGSFELYYVFGFIASCVVGIFSLRFLLKVLLKNKFYIFGIYCIIIGTLTFIFLK